MNIRPSIEDLRHIPITPVLSGSQEDLITVSSATGRVAFAYERFRNTLEPDEADILRRKAIARMLERRLLVDRPLTATALSLLQELIRAHYITPLPTAYVQSLALLLGNIQAVASHLQGEQSVWFLQMMAVAVDRLMFPRVQQERLVHVMYHDTFRRMAWTDYAMAEADRPAQLYVVCHRALFAADNHEIMYHYFVNYFPAWKQERMSQEEIADIIRQLHSFQETVTKIVQHPLRDRLLRIMRPVAVPYRIIWDLTSAQRQDIFADETTLSQGVREAVGRAIERIRARSSRRAWHSILFLFFTKTILALLVELPYELLVFRFVHYPALAANIGFHPLLLFFLGTTARVPGAANTEKIVEQVAKIITGEGELPTIIVPAPRQYGAITWSFFALIYTALFLLMFWGIFGILNYLQFSLVAMGMFVIFLGLVSFLSVRIRRSVDEIRLLPRSEGAMSAIASFLFLPMLEFGRFLTQNISQLNFLLFLMDRVLEAPFKLLIDVVEEWFVFVRDRREEIV